jgi:hypothetical protein
MKTAAGLLFLALAASLPARAQVADLTRASCRQFMDLPRGERGQLIVWLHGYYAGAAQRAVIDRAKLETAAAAVEEACTRNGDMPLIGIEARAIFLGEPVPPAQAAPSPAQSQAAPDAFGASRPAPLSR